MKMMELEYQLKIPPGRVQLACQREKMQKDCNSVVLLGDQICIHTQICILHVVHSECKVVHPDAEEDHWGQGQRSVHQIQVDDDIYMRIQIYNPPFSCNIDNPVGRVFLEMSAPSGHFLKDQQ